MKKLLTVLLIGLSSVLHFAAGDPDDPSPIDGSAHTTGTVRSLESNAKTAAANFAKVAFIVYTFEKKEYVYFVVKVVRPAACKLHREKL